MNTNIFRFQKRTKEDHFTTALAFILNRFPREIGDTLLRRISTLSGHTAESLGRFEEAKFIGYELQDDDATSKPDMRIRTSKTTLLWENKIEAGLSVRQLERHLEVAKRMRGKLVFFSNIASSVSEDVLKSPNYLKPTSASHVRWADIEPVFNGSSRKGSLAYALLSDFRAGMHSSGMRSREIDGARGSLYTKGSEALDKVLDEYQEMLRQMGWKASRRANETTLRVYPLKNGVYPLFNPRFYSSGAWLIEESDEECNIVHCWATPRQPAARRKIAKLADLSENGIGYVESDPRWVEERWLEGRWVPEGYLYIPLRFKEVGRKFAVQWENIASVWCAMRELTI